MQEFCENVSRNLQEFCENTILSRKSGVEKRSLKVFDVDS